MARIVKKFGGTSVATVSRIKTIASHIAKDYREGKELVVVVSAMGKETDRLKALAYELSSAPSSRELDVLLTAGERVSMSLMSMALQDLEIPSVSLTGSQSGILTDTNHGNAKIKRILGDRIRDGLKQKAVVIVAGFQGMAIPSKNISTLGRGGSDLTAVALAHVLEADLCEIYTDVDGVYNTDPRHYTQAQMLEEITYNDLLHLAWHGAAVVHSRAAQLASKHKIPMTIRSSFNFDTKGTKIMTHRSSSTLAEVDLESADIVAITEQKGLARLIWNIDEETNVSSLHGDVSAFLWSKGVTPIIHDYEVTDKGLTIDIVFDQRFVDELVEKLAAKTAQTTSDLSCITVVGHGFWQDHDTSGAVVSKAGPHFERFVKNNETLKFVLKEGDSNACLDRLRSEFL